MIRRQGFHRWLRACGCLLVAFPTGAGAGATAEPIRVCASALFRDRVAAIAPSGADIDKILRPALWIKQVESPKLKDLPFQLYEVQYTLVRPSVTAYLVVDETDCQLVAGDLSEILGREMDWEQKQQFAIDGLNGFLDRNRHPVPTEDRGFLRYAYGIATVLYVADQIEILDDVSSLQGIINETAIEPDDDGDTAARITQALEAYEAPRVWRNQSARVAEFCSWISLGGALLRHRISILSDGTINQHSDTLVREVGRYTKVRYRM
jgi:hypothetical protein